MNEGFVEAKVQAPKLSFSKDKKSLVIDIFIEEGLRFKLGDLSFSGDLEFSENELKKDLKIQKTKFFSYGALQFDIFKLQNKYKDLGYALAQVFPQTARDPLKPQVLHLNFVIKKSKKFKIGEVNVHGNYKTKERVLLREMPFYPGELYTGTGLAKAQANIQRLGFFEEVSWKENPSKDKINLDLHLKEKESINSIQLGAGFNDIHGFLIQGQFKILNLLGNGQSLNASLDLNKSNNLINIQFLDPYILDSNWGTGVEIYNTNESYADYLQQKKGLSVSLNRKFKTFFRLGSGYRLEKVFLEDAVENQSSFSLSSANGCEQRFKS